eukprot:gene17206-22727_t
MSIKPFQNENLNIDNDNDDVLKAINIKQAREKYEKSIIRRKSSLLISSSDKNNLLNEDAIHDISTLDHPKIDSLEEKLEDLRQEEVEKWCFRRGKKPAYKLLNKEKRQLRKWFKEIDVDGSGEVTAVELEDALLSSGIFKTREQVHRVLSNIDKNQTNGIDFEEFLIALQSNTIAKDSNKLKRLQEMSSNELGFSMDTGSPLMKEKDSDVLLCVACASTYIINQFGELELQSKDNKIVSSDEIAVESKSNVINEQSSNYKTLSYDKETESDKISKLISSKLLLGYVMLDAVCGLCTGTVPLLRDKNNQEYCVICGIRNTEVITKDVIKANDSLDEFEDDYVEVKSIGTKINSKDIKLNNDSVNTPNDMTDVKAVLHQVKISMLRYS